MFGVVGDGPGTRQRQLRIDDDVGVGGQPVTVPSHLQPAHTEHPRNGRQVSLGGRDDVGVDSVHEPAEDFDDGTLEDDQDREGDQDADDRVCQREAQQYADRADRDRQGREAVGAGVQAIRDQRSGADLPADPDPIDRHQFVTGEPDQPGREDDPDMADRLLIDQSPDRLVSGQHSRQRDHRDDEQPGQILGPAVTVGVPAGRLPARQRKGDPQRYCRQRVGEVMDRIGQQCDRAGEDHDQQLGDRGEQQDQQADLQGADAGGIRFQRIVDGIGGIVAVRLEHRYEEPLDPGRVRMPMGVIVGMPMVVIVAVVVGMAVVMPVVMIVVVGVTIPHVGLRGCHPVTSSCWWCRGVPSTECSAWKIASDTSWLACSFASR